MLIAPMIFRLALGICVSVLPNALQASAADSAEDCNNFSDVDFSGHFSEELGERLYHRGLYPEAMTVWRCAFLKEGDAGAAYRIAIEYIDAKIVERDPKRAIQLLTSSATWGEQRAQMELGTIYEDGEIAEQDPTLAMLWYMAAARQGHAVAEYSLGLIHETGIAAGQDRILAYAYYELSYRHGLELAQEGLDRLAPELSDREIEIAMTAARHLETVRSKLAPQ